jgi:uncharacterized protein YutE (UPF0331/DUF86 family)
LVDEVLVLRKLTQLEEYLEQVREFSILSIADYSADWKAQRIVERTLQMMIELCIDIAGHLVSDRRLRIPVSYADTFRVLVEGGILDGDLGRIMENMAKFRNVVVHHYDLVDSSIVITILRKHLDDFMQFRDAVLKVMRAEGPPADG